MSSCRRRHRCVGLSESRERVGLSPTPTDVGLNPTAGLKPTVGLDPVFRQLGIYKIGARLNSSLANVHFSLFWVLGQIPPLPLPDMG